MHRVADDVEAAVSVPLVHIGDAVADAAGRLGAGTLGVVGTQRVMAERFYADRLGRHGIRVVVPPSDVQSTLDRIVFDELTRGVVTEPSRAVFRDAFAALVDEGAEAIVLACTEIMLLVDAADAADAAVPLIDSCAAHADALARIALGERSAGALAPELPHRLEDRADGGHALGAVPMPQRDRPA
jgi:aspartate racemase